MLLYWVFVMGKRHIGSSVAFQIVVAVNVSLSVHRNFGSPHPPVIKENPNVKEETGIIREEKKIILMKFA